MKIVLAFVALLFGIVGIAAPAVASDEHGLTQYFSDATVGPSDVVHGNVNVVFGNAHINGAVDGDVNVLGGSCDLGPDARIGGRSNCATPALAALTPFVSAEQDHDLYLRLASAVVSIVLFLLFPLRTRLALDRVERHPGLAALVGVGGFLAVLPLAILLAITVVGIPLEPVLVAATFAGIWIGIGSVALLLGRRLAEVVAPRSTPSPFAALLLGLVVITAAEMLPVVGGVVTAIVFIIGFGATIASFVGIERLNLVPGISRRPIA